MSFISQSYHIQIMIGQLLRLRFAFLMKLDRRQRQVFQNSHMGIEIKLLKNHGGGLPHQLCFILMGQLLAIDKDMAAGGLLQKIHAPDRSGFSGAGWTDNHQFFPFCNLQIHILQYMQITKIFINIFQFNHRAPLFCIRSHLAQHFRRKMPHTAETVLFSTAQHSVRLKRGTSSGRLNRKQKEA